MAPTPNITPIEIPAFAPVLITVACGVVVCEGTVVTVVTVCDLTKLIFGEKVV